MNQQWLLKMRPAPEYPVAASKKGTLLGGGGGVFLQIHKNDGA